MSDAKLKDDHYWKGKLSAEEFRICREKGTERAFTGEYWNTKESGTYLCRCCGTALFTSESKFDSGTGWPSFTQAINQDVIGEHHDATLGMSRVEVVCNACESHLGHVFPDGPAPTGMRYCVNSASIKLDKEEN